MFLTEHSGKKFIVTGLKYSTLYGDTNRKKELNKLISENDLKPIGVIVSSETPPASTVGLVPKDAEKLPSKAYSVAACFALYAQKNSCPDAILILDGAVVAISNGLPFSEYDSNGAKLDAGICSSYYSMFSSGCVVFGDRAVYQEVQVTPLTIEEIVSSLSKEELESCRIKPIGGSLPIGKIVVITLVVLGCAFGYMQHEKSKKRKAMLAAAEEEARIANSPANIFKKGVEASIAGIPSATCSKKEVMDYFIAAWNMPMQIAGWNMTSVKLNCGDPIKIDYKFVRNGGTFEQIYRAIGGGKNAQWKFDTGLSEADLIVDVKRAVENQPVIQPEKLVTFFDFIRKYGSYFQSLKEVNAIDVQVSPASVIGGEPPPDYTETLAAKGGIAYKGEARNIPMVLEILGNTARYTTAEIVPDKSDVKHQFTLNGEYYVKK